MGKQELVAKILSLPVDERLEVAEAIWATPDETDTDTVKI